MAYVPFKKAPQKPPINNFILAQKRGCAVLFARDGLKPVETISGIVHHGKLNYSTHSVDTTTQTPADINHLIYSKPVFRDLKPKIIVLLFIENVDKTMQDYITIHIIPNIKKKFIIFVIDDSEWTPWIGYWQKSTLPQFKLDAPNNIEKSLYLNKLNPYQLVYDETKQSKTFQEKLNQVSDKIKNFSQLENYVAGVRAMNGVYDFHTENECEENFFKTICFLRSEAHARTKDEWDKIEDTLEKHPTALKTLMINPPSFKSSSSSYSLKCRARWLEDFSELDTCGYEKPDLTPCYIASAAWNECYGNWNMNCREQGKTPWYSVTKKTWIESNQNNLHSANEYLSNQLNFFQIFDTMTQVSNPKWLFQHYCKVVHDPIIVDLLVKKLSNLFGILLLSPSFKNKDIPVMEEEKLKEEEEKFECIDKKKSEMKNKRPRKKPKVVSKKKKSSKKIFD